MKRLTILSAATACFVAAAAIAEAGDKDKSALNFTMKNINGEEVKLSKKYAGKVVLVVNVASQCGLTPQYKQLQALHEKYAKQGLAVVGFPCNQFGRQEPGSASEIKQFCTENYGVKFDMYSKVAVNGKNACDLYKYLTAQKTKPKGSGKVSWNFEKFLIGRDGKLVARYSPRTKPDDKSVVEQIETQLKKK